MLVDLNWIICVFDYLHGGRSFPFFGQNWSKSSDLGREQPGCPASVSFRPDLRAPNFRTARWKQEQNE
jgi:hypothetical protein